MRVKRTKNEVYAGQKFRPKQAERSNCNVLAWLLPFTFGGLLTGAIALVAMYKAGHTADAIYRGKAEQTLSRPYPRRGELVVMSGDELARQDVALINLRCAEGLPSSEGLDLRKTLAILDRWTKHVRFETDRHLYKFRQSPAEYDNSEGYFRMLMLVTVLQQDFNVHYNLDRIRNVDFRRSQDLFIHGMINCDNGGTCVSMPVLYTAVARRLGYPLYLVLAKGHVFCRWESPKFEFCRFLGVPRSKLISASEAPLG